MSRALIDRMRAERDQHVELAETLLTRQEESGELSDVDAANLAAATERASVLNDRIRGIVETDLARAETDDMLARLLGRRDEPGSSTDQPGRPQVTRLGAAFTGSDAFTRYQQAPLGTSGRWTTELALITREDVNGTPVAGTFRKPDAALPTARTPLLDAMGYQPVGGMAVDWVEWPVDVPVAGVVAEGAVKPEATYAPVVRSGVLDTYAHHVPITRQALLDSARIQAVVEGALVTGVRRAAELAAAAKLNAAAIPTVTAGATLLEAIRVGMAEVEDAGWDPAVVVMNPADYADVDISLLGRTLQGAAVQSTVWGLRVIASGQITAGSALVGDLASAATYLDRGQVQVYITDSHASEFTSNILRILAEANGLTVVERADALRKVAPTAP